MKTYLSVPYAEKDEAKKLGARWDSDKKSWYTEADDLTPFEIWNTGEPVKKVVVEQIINDEDFDVIIYADGASKGNPGKGGWGVFMTQKDNVTELHGGENNVSNNQMEITAVIKALEIADKSLRVLIRTDSQYVVSGCTKWVHGWIKNGWKSSTGDTVKNKDLWEKLYSFLTQHSNITFQWVKGHSGDAGNDRADELANIGCSEV